MVDVAETLDARLNTRIPRRMRDDIASLSRQRRMEESELARTLLDEGLRREKHPGVVFRPTPAGRQAAIEGRRLYVWQVMETVWASDGDVDEAAQYLGIRPDQVQSAVDYCVEYRTEIEDQIRRNQEEAEHARDLWERRQQALHP
jgi:uncharacterized protein (DUF433 family)